METEQEKNCRWHFAKQLGGREDGPNDPMQDNFKKTPYASLIRESIQNSLDVCLHKDKPVRMEFSIRRMRAKEYPNFFDIKKHIQGCLNHFNDNDDAEAIYQPMLDYLNSLGTYDRLYYIKVSDYNTTGMKYKKGDTSNPFYAFVRAAGVSSKNDKAAGGSYGYGKAAYFYISPIRTIFVSTQTEHNQHFFEGVSSLCTHVMDSVNDLRVSVGYYDNNEGEPITNQNDIPLRFRRDEPGTDIFILGIDASDKQSIYEEMTMATLRNFWMAIEKGKLQVKIDQQDITKETLPMMFDSYFPYDQDNARREKNYNPRPYWEAVHNAGIDKKHILIHENLPILGKVKFYALKDKRAADKILYMRKPMMLVKARRTQSSNGFYGVFLCTDHYGNSYLRKTENPAHDEWSASNWKENGRNAQKAKEAIDDVNQFIIKVMEKMFSRSNSEIQQIQGLDEFLYIPTAVENDDDYEMESLVGDVVDLKDEEGNSISTDITKSDVNPIQESPALGKVLESDPVNHNIQKDKKGGVLSGHGTRKKEKHGGGGLTSKKIEGHFSYTDDGLEGSTLQEIPVLYRAFAQTIDGKIMHTLVIRSDYEVNNGRIDLIIGGEQTDEAVAIEWCSEECEIDANTISGLHIHQGKNIINVKFADNMKHAIKLDAYELK